MKNFKVFLLLIAMIVCSVQSFASDYHILNKSVDDKTVDCIFHVAIPDVNNLVGTNWRTAIKRHFNPAPLMDWNDAMENAAITNGEIFEIRATVRFSSINLTNAQRLTEVEDFYSSESAGALQKLSKLLDFFGLDGDI